MIAGKLQQDGHVSTPASFPEAYTRGDDHQCGKYTWRSRLSPVVNGEQLNLITRRDSASHRRNGINSGDATQQCVSLQRRRTVLVKIDAAFPEMAHTVLGTRSYLAAALSGRTSGTRHNPLVRPAAHRGMRGGHGQHTKPIMVSASAAHAISSNTPQSHGQHFAAALSCCAPEIRGSVSQFIWVGEPVSCVPCTRSALPRHAQSRDSYLPAGTVLSSLNGYGGRAIVFLKRPLRISPVSPAKMNARLNAGYRASSSRRTSSCSRSSRGFTNSRAVTQGNSANRKDSRGP